ncbi:TIGR00730 family Rossman fold protein [Leucothrix pacifica]|uniref:Cytokinin riboside 5'-monophosphate phosphoribohydrolase n=2 Tax=Leucothrix pacifica TaxID=1247513 RepID=A0A317C9C9_9GAMM|nr:TIGR00730 family Rossman fold protein [Leucothrix pacifica]
MKRICVYCGSSMGKKQEYAEAAKALGQALVERNIGLVYGGASVGIMGLIADTVLSLGGEVIGVIPQAIADKEIAHTGLTELKVVANMHERKAMMAEYSDGFIALPGGMGTLEELFEVLTWGQLGFHQKPTGVLNVDGYYDHLIAFLEHAVDQEYLKANHLDMLQKASEPMALLDLLRDYQAPAVGKWVDRKDL